MRGLAVLYPCLTALAVLATGNHYVLDISRGLAALALGADRRGARWGASLGSAAGRRTGAQR